MRTNSLEKSHSLLPPGGVSPLTTGAMNCGHSLSHIDRKTGIELAVGPTNESKTVDTNCGYILDDTSTSTPATDGGSEFRIIVVASFRVYGGKLICGTAAACKKSGWGVVLRTSTTDSEGITSPNLANAGSNVPGASRCLSIPSSTNTNFPVVDARISPSNTASALTCSHRPFPNLSHSSFRPNASNVVHTIFVRRCRPVMHSVLRTMACGISRAERTARTIVDLQVADIPWRTNVEGLGI